MSKGLRTALKQMRNAADNCRVESQDHAEYPNERSRELLFRAHRVLMQLSNALESGRGFADLTTSAAQKFDHTLKTES